MNDLLFIQLEELAGEKSCAAASRLFNLIACLYWSDPHISWAGIYRALPEKNFTGRRKGGENPGDKAGEELVCILDGFQGKPACMTIGPHKGVIGHAVDSRQSVKVADVHTFAGHIACDPASRSELVIPLFDEKHLIGVLDLDSDLPNHFETVSDSQIRRLQNLFEGLLALRLREECLLADQS